MDKQISSQKLWWFILVFFSGIAFLLLFSHVSKGLLATNLSNLVGWGLWIAFYIFFIGVSIGLFLIHVLGYIYGRYPFKRFSADALLLSIVTFIIGGLFALIDIGHLGRIWTVFIYRNTSSVMSWEIQLYLLYFLLLSTYSYLFFTRKKYAWQKKLAFVGIPLAIAVHGGTGAVFAVVKARSFWNTGLFPVVFLVSAFLSGLAFMLLVSSISKEYKFDDALRKNLGTWLGYFLVFDIGIIAMQYLIGSYTENLDQLLVFNLITSGQYSSYFWVGQIGMGIIAPLMLIAQNNRKHSSVIALFTGMGVIIGVFIARMNIVVPQLSVPVLRGLEKTYSVTRGEAYYTPSFVEWLYSFIIVSLGLNLFFFLRSTVKSKWEKQGRDFYTDSQKLSKDFHDGRNVPLN